MFRLSILITAIAAGVVASACALSASVSPASFRWLGAFVLGYPVLTVAALLLQLLCLMVWLRRAWIPFVVGLPAYWAIGTYAPLHFPSEPEGKPLRVMTYNVLRFGWYDWGEGGRPPIAQYINYRRPDIVFLQETPMEDDFWDNGVMPTVRPSGLRHRAQVYCGMNAVSMLSRYPILSHGRIDMPGPNNGAAWFRILRAKGDTLLAINCHLQSLGLSETERKDYSQIAAHPNGEPLGETERTSRSILSKIAAASVVRAKQAEALLAFIDRHRGAKVILAGDFNDTPISYAHHTIERRLTDAYRASGRGIGRSFNQHRMIVRIDHLFCSEHFTPLRARIDQSIHESDHYPLLVDLREEP